MNETGPWPAEEARAESVGSVAPQSAALQAGAEAFQLELQGLVAHQAAAGALQAAAGARQAAALSVAPLATQLERQRAAALRAATSRQNAALLLTGNPARV